MTGHFIVILLFSLLGSCFGNPNAAGSLQPQPDGGFKVVRVGPRDRAAQIDFGDVIVNVGGYWANLGSQRIDLQINNNSNEPFSFDYKKVSFQNESGESLVLFRVIDTTEFDNRDEILNNDKVLELYNRGNKTDAKFLTVDPKKSRSFTLQFNNFTNPQNQLREDETVIVTIPVSETTERRIFFKTV